MSDAAATAMSLPEVARRLPRLRAGRPVAPETIYRWITAGVRGPAGLRVKLRALRIGCRWAVLQGDLDEFFSALARPAAAEIESTVRTPGQRRRGHEHATRELERMGV